MLKTVSAALLAVSVVAAPALAASTGKTAQAPITKSATATPSAQAKKNPFDARARMNHRHHVRHHRLHKKMAAKLHKSLKVSAKPVMHSAKQG